MIKEINKLKVKYNGITVGCLVEFENGKTGFQYDDEWLKIGFSISPFSLPLKSDVFISQNDVFGGLYGVFWDSLPDGWGELLVDRMLAKKGLNYKTTEDFELTNGKQNFGVRDIEVYEVENQ